MPARGMWRQSPDGQAPLCFHCPVPLPWIPISPPLCLVPSVCVVPRRLFPKWRRCIPSVQENFLHGTATWVGVCRQAQSKDSTVCLAAGRHLRSGQRAFSALPRVAAPWQNVTRGSFNNRLKDCLRETCSKVASGTVGALAPAATEVEGRHWVGFSSRLVCPLLLHHSPSARWWGCFIWRTPPLSWSLPFSTRTSRRCLLGLQVSASCSFSGSWQVLNATSGIWLHRCAG